MLTWTVEPVPSHASRIAGSERGAVDLDVFIDLYGGFFAGERCGSEKQGSAEEKTLGEVLAVHRISL
jgi:hypothetical protein